MPKDACYYEAKKRYRIFPSAYASGYIAKCRKRKNKRPKTSKSSSNLRRWYREDWRDEMGNKCGTRKRALKKCRPTKRINSKTPVTWSEMTAKQKMKAIRDKKRVGMGKRAPSIKRKEMIGGMKRRIRRQLVSFKRNPRHFKIILF